jgi:crossover junction endodeoxyribonuclease RuvC
MKTMGIDPGTATTGYCVLETSNNDRPSIITYGIIKTTKKDTAEKRLSLIHDQMKKLFKQYKPDNMAIERLFFGSNAKTAMSVGQAKGVILLAASKAGVEVAEYTPQQVKIALTGYGRADKSQIQHMVKRLLGMKDIPRPDDAADAIAIALTHMNSDGFNSRIRKAV